MGPGEPKIDGFSNRKDRRAYFKRTGIKLRAFNKPYVKPVTR